MDERRTISLFKLLTTAACTVAAAGLLTSGAAWSATEQDNFALGQLENRLFFTNYSKEEVTTRLSRLEKRVFGDELDGTVDERLQRLIQTQKAPLNPYVKQEQTVKPAPKTEEKRPQEFFPAVQTASAPAKPAVKANDVNEQDCAIDRARVAVRAAKDEEISRLLAEGVELWRAKRGQEATDRFEQVVRLDPNNAQAHFSMGIITESEGNFVEAVASYRKAAEARPNNRDYKEALAAAEKKANTTQVTIEKRSEISRMAEDATAAFRRGEYLSALDLYKRIDQKAPRQALIKYNIGSIYLVMKQPERALDYYKEARKLNPGEPRYVQAFDQLQAVLRQDEGQRRNQYEQNKLQARVNALKPTAAPMSESAMASFGILGKSQSDGVCITTVGLASKALRAGLQRGDIIKAVDGTVVKNTRELNEILSRKSPGQSVQMVVQRARTLAQVTL